MSITTSLCDDAKVVTIHVQGRFDSSKHWAFHRAFTEHTRGKRYFVVDRKPADYTDSVAMRMLQLRDYGAKGRAIELVNGGADTLEILHSANLDKIFRAA